MVVETVGLLKGCCGSQVCLEVMEQQRLKHFAETDPKHLDALHRSHLLVDADADDVEGPFDVVREAGGRVCVGGVGRSWRRYSGFYMVFRMF